MIRYLFIFVLTAAAFAQFDPTASNGPGCAAVSGYCTSVFTGLTTGAGNTNAQTQIPVPAPANISSLSVRNYLYAGATTPVGIHYQPWFTPSNSHMSVGYDEKNPATVTAQMLWWKSLGFDFMSIDYYGNHSSKLKNLQVVQNVASVMAASPSTYPLMSLGIDEGSWNSASSETGSRQCPNGSGITDAQMEGCVEDQFDYAASNYFFQSYYYKVSAKPLVTLFLSQSNWPSVNWANVYSHLKAHTTAGQSCANGTLYPGCTYATSLVIMDRNSGACTDPSLDGCYGWSPTTGWVNSSPSTQFLYDGSSGYLANLYSTAQANHKLVMGLGYARFDNTVASFTPPKMVAAQCGQVLVLTTGAIVTAGYSVSNQLPLLQFQTGNDYEESTSLETGVDTCFSATVSASGLTFNYTLTKTDTTYASLTTLDHLQVLYCTSVTSCKVASGLGNITPALSGSVSLAAVPTGTWQMRIQAVGKPLMRNVLSSNFASVTVGPTAPAGPLFTKISEVKTGWQSATP